MAKKKAKGAPVSPAQAPIRPEPAEPKREYIYSFELMRQFSSVRSFIFKKQLTKSMADTFMELFGSSKKRR
jgi:hypothetical protein